MSYQDRPNTPISTYHLFSILEPTPHRNRTGAQTQNIVGNEQVPTFIRLIYHHRTNLFITRNRSTHPQIPNKMPYNIVPYLPTFITLPGGTAS